MLNIKEIRLICKSGTGRTDKVMGLVPVRIFLDVRANPLSLKATVRCPRIIRDGRGTRPAIKGWSDFCERHPQRNGNRRQWGRIEGRRISSLACGL